jgi:hypothetical protein
MGPMKLRELAKPTLELFQALTEDQLALAIRWLKQINFPVTVESRQRGTLNRAMAQTLPEDLLTPMDDFLGFVIFLLNGSDDHGQFLEISREAMSEIQDDDAKTRAEKFFTALNFQDYFHDRRLSGYLTRANSYYTDMEYACDLRGRFDKDFNYKDIPVEQYDPGLIDFSPIVNIMIDLYDGTNEQKVWFQADANDLNEMIAYLLAAQKELKILTDFVKRDRDGKD